LQLASLLFINFIFEYSYNSMRTTAKPTDMRLLILFFCFFVLLLVVSLSWSWEASQFRWVKSDNGDVLCATSPASKTLNAVETRVKCMSACLHVCPSPCQAVNYWKKAELCQHFYYMPTAYAAQEDCINYQVMFIAWCIITFL